MYEDWTTDELLQHSRALLKEFSPNMGEQNRRVLAHRFWPVHDEIMRRAGRGGEVVDDKPDPASSRLPAAIIAGVLAAVGGACVAVIWKLVGAL